MGRDRLVGLALLNIHRHRAIQIEEVIDLFAAMKKMNIDLILSLVDENMF